MKLNLQNIETAVLLNLTSGIYTLCLSYLTEVVNIANKYKKCNSQMNIYLF